MGKGKWKFNGIFEKSYVIFYTKIFVVLSGNAISHPYYNEAFSEINDLRVFSDRLRDALFPPEPAPEDGEQ